MTMYGEPKYLGRRKRVSREERESESLFEYVARQNGPLDDYHPQMVLQCLLWGASTARTLPSVNADLAIWDRESGVGERYHREPRESCWCV